MQEVIFLAEHCVRRTLKEWIIPLLCIILLIQGTAEAFTFEDERKLGREIYEKLEKDQFLLKNERANAYIEGLGERILKHSDPVPLDFKFSILRSSAVNAFATPGGYIYLNQGLINLCNSEAELAGVLAHEIAHINGRHIANNISRSKKINISTLAAILAGALLGGGGDLTAAVTSFSVATATTLSLKYSREQEEAADRMGLSYLVAAGYDGASMLDFLKSMRRFEFYSNTVPSYFLTHPGTDERTRYLDALLQTTYNQGGAKEIIGGLTRIQTLLLINSRPANTNLAHFQRLSKENDGDVNALYGLAITQERLGMIPEALENFHKALRLAPDDGDVLRDLGITYFKFGQLQKAVAPLRRAVLLNTDDPDALLHLGRTLEALGDLPAALKIYQQFGKKSLDNEEILYNLAMAYGKADLPGDSHYYFGLYFKKKERKETALFHFQAALKHLAANSDRGREIAKEIKALKR